MKKLIYIFALTSIFLASCNNDLIDSKINFTKTSTTLLNDNANGQRRPVILGKKLNNPYSVKNMQVALDTLKKHSVQQNTSMKAPSATLEEMNIEEFILKIEDEFDDMVPGKLKPDSIFRDMFEWNSVNALTMIAMVDCEYDVRLVADDFQKSKTVQDLFDIVLAKAN